MNKVKPVFHIDGLYSKLVCFCVMLYTWLPFLLFTGEI